MDIPAKVITAINHVRQSHPNVVKVTFNKDGQWLFANADGSLPDFDEKDIDTNILEAAVNDAYNVAKFPITYEIPAPKFNQYFLVGRHYVYDIGEYDSLESARASDDCARFGGSDADSLVLNRAEAHEVMRQLKLKLSFYDNSMLKQ